MAYTAPLLDSAAAQALARLAGARATGRPCAPVRTLLPAGDIDAAYDVQTAWVAAQVAAGGSMDCPQGEPVDTGRLLQPRIEAEIAFVLARDLDDPGPGADDVLAATGAVAAALEIVDSRIAGWDISIVDTVADNASSGLFTLGHPAAAVAWLAAAAQRYGQPLRAGEIVLSGALTGTG